MFYARILRYSFMYWKEKKSGLELYVCSIQISSLSVGVRHKSSLNKDQLDKIANGPGITDFVAGYAPQTPDYLIRKKGQR